MRCDPWPILPANQSAPGPSVFAAVELIIPMAHCRQWKQCPLLSSPGTARTCAPSGGTKGAMSQLLLLHQIILSRAHSLKNERKLTCPDPGMVA